MKYHLDLVPHGKNILLGGGTLLRDGWLNWDLYVKNADIKHDLTSFPYPLKDNSVDHLEATNIFEHLADWKHTLLECHRILKPGGKLLIQVPHYGSVYMWSHFDHKAAFSLFSFDSFAANSGDYFVEGACNDAMLHKTKKFAKVTRYLMFPKGKWFWGYAFEKIANLCIYTQLFHELWLSGIFKPSGVLVILEK